MLIEYLIITESAKIYAYCVILKHTSIEQTYSNIISSKFSLVYYSCKHRKKYC